MMALLVIDMQVGLVDGEPLYRKVETLKTIQTVLAQARTASVPIFYMQDVDVGGVGTPDFEIHSSVHPLANEPVIVKTEADSFYETDLHEQLQAQDVDTLVIVGLKTEYCVDATVRRAYELGYKVYLVADGHTTTDRDYMTAAQVVQHHNWLLACIGTDDLYNEVIPAAQVTFSEPTVIE